MRLPRVRSTVRGMMLLVAMTAPAFYAAKLTGLSSCADDADKAFWPGGGGLGACRPRLHRRDRASGSD